MICRKLLFVLGMTGMIKAYAAYDPSDIVKAYVGASVKYDSNLYRRSNSTEAASSGLPEKTDVIFEPRAGLKIDKTISLQQIGLDLNVNAPAYTNSDHIDYTGWKNLAYWNWAVGKRLTGSLRYQDNKSISGFDDVIAVPDNCPVLNATPINDNYIVDVYRDKRLSFDAGWLIGHNVRLGAGLSRNANSHSQRVCLDQVQTGYQLSLAFVSDAGNELGVFYGRSEADYENSLEYSRLVPSAPDPVTGQIVLVPTTQHIPAALRAYQVDEFGAQLKWKHSPKTEFSLRWGLSSVDFADGSRGSSSAVGNVTLLWRPSVKTTLTTSYERLLESGTDRIGRNLLDKYQLRADWAATAITSAYVNAHYLLREYETGRSQQNVGLVGRRDKDVTLETGINYRPVPALVITSYINFLKRDANVVRADYAATIVGFTSQWWF